MLNTFLDGGQQDLSIAVYFFHFSESSKILHDVVDSMTSAGICCRHWIEYRISMQGYI